MGLVEDLQKKIDLMKKQMEKQQRQVRSQLPKSKKKYNQGFSKQKKPIRAMLSQQETEINSMATGKIPEPIVKEVPPATSNAKWNRNKRNKRKCYCRQRNNNVSNSMRKVNNCKNRRPVFRSTSDSRNTAKRNRVMLQE